MDQLEITGDHVVVPLDHMTSQAQESARSLSRSHSGVQWQRTQSDDRQAFLKCEIALSSMI